MQRDLDLRSADSVRAANSVSYSLDVEDVALQERLKSMVDVTMVSDENGPTLYEMERLSSCASDTRDSAASGGSSSARGNNNMSHSAKFVKNKTLSMQLDSQEVSSSLADVDAYLRAFENDAQSRKQKIDGVVEERKKKRARGESATTSGTMRKAKRIISKQQPWVSSSSSSPPLSPEQQCVKRNESRHRAHSFTGYMKTVVSNLGSTTSKREPKSSKVAISRSSRSASKPTDRASAAKSSKRSKLQRRLPPRPPRDHAAIANVDIEEFSSSSEESAGDDDAGTFSFLSPSPSRSKGGSQAAVKSHNRSSAAKSSHSDRNAPVLLPWNLKPTHATPQHGRSPSRKWLDSGSSEKPRHGGYSRRTNRPRPHLSEGKAASRVWCLRQSIDSARVRLEQAISNLDVWNVHNSHEGSPSQKLRAGSNPWTCLPRLHLSLLEPGKCASMQDVHGFHGYIVECRVNRVEHAPNAPNDQCCLVKGGSPVAKRSLALTTPPVAHDGDSAAPRLLWRARSLAVTVNSPVRLFMPSRQSTASIPPRLGRNRRGSPHNSGQKHSQLCAKVLGRLGHGLDGNVNNVRDITVLWPWFVVKSCGGLPPIIVCPSLVRAEKTNS